METITLYNQAEDLLESAQEEMMRPEEDIVPYLVCQKCFYAISHYLKGYLKHQDINYSTEAELTELLDLALQSNDQFKAINRTFLKQPADTEDVWMNIDRARDFIELTKKTRYMVGL